MATVLNLDEIKSLVNIPHLIQDIEAGFVLYCEGRVKVRKGSCESVKLPPSPRLPLSLKDLA